MHDQYLPERRRISLDGALRARSVALRCARMTRMSMPADSAEVTESTGVRGDSTTPAIAPPAASDPPQETAGKELAGSSIAFTATLILLVGLALFGRKIFAGAFTDDGI